MDTNITWITVKGRHVPVKKDFDGRSDTDVIREK